MRENIHRHRMPKCGCILSCMGGIEKWEYFWVGPKDLELHKMLEFNMVQQPSLATNATGAFDFGMPLGKLALFSTTVARLRTTDQWLQYSLCGRKAILFILEWKQIDLNQCLQNEWNNGVLSWFLSFPLVFVDVWMAKKKEPESQMKTTWWEINGNSRTSLFDS